MSLVNWLVLNPQLVAHLLVIQYGNRSSIAHLLNTKQSPVQKTKINSTFPIQRAGSAQEGQKFLSIHGKYKMWPFGKVKSKNCFFCTCEQRQQKSPWHDMNHGNPDWWMTRSFSWCIFYHHHIELGTYSSHMCTVRNKDILGHCSCELSKYTGDTRIRRYYSSAISTKIWPLNRWGIFLPLFWIIAHP